MRRRKFLSGSPNHIYQRSQNSSVIFYSLEDCLVYFTVFCTCAWKRRQAVHAASQHRHGQLHCHHCQAHGSALSRLSQRMKRMSEWQ